MIDRSPKIITLIIVIKIKKIKTNNKNIQTRKLKINCKILKSIDLLQKNLKIENNLKKNYKINFNKPSANPNFLILKKTLL